MLTMSDESIVILKQALQRYKATVCFVEESENVVAYYCYTEQFQNGIRLNGVTINLQIALSKDCAVLGTPIIFGGF